MRKRILSLVLAVCVFMATVPALAYAESDYKDRIIDTLNAIETQKENVGLGRVDFSKLKIGEEVHVYNYANGEFVEVRSAFPLFAEDVMVAIMYSIGEDSYQLMGKLPERINSTGFTKLAIIYDRMGCYVYNGDEMEMIAEADMVDLSKDVLTVDEIEDFGDIELADLQYKVDLGYTSPVQSRVQTTYTLNISQVL